MLELVAQGLGVGLPPNFLSPRHDGLRVLTAPLDECQTELWLLAHPESGPIGNATQQQDGQSDLV